MLMEWERNAQNQTSQLPQSQTLTHALHAQKRNKRNYRYNDDYIGGGLSGRGRMKNFNGNDIVTQQSTFMNNQKSRRMNAKITHIESSCEWWDTWGCVCVRAHCTRTCSGGGGVGGGGLTLPGNSVYSRYVVNATTTTTVRDICLFAGICTCWKDFIHFVYFSVYSIAVCSFTYLRSICTCRRVDTHAYTQSHILYMPFGHRNFVAVSSCRLCLAIIIPCLGIIMSSCNVGVLVVAVVHSRSWWQCSVLASASHILDKYYQQRIEETTIFIYIYNSHRTQSALRFVWVRARHFLSAESSPRAGIEWEPLSKYQV